MKLKKRLTKEIEVLGIVLLFTIVSVSILFFTLSNSLNAIILETEPTHAAMEHMIQDVYQDNIILVEYLNTNKYDDATLLDYKVEESNERCDEVENNIENLIITEIISDEEVINDYQNAYLIHEEVEDVRDRIIAMHKEELATGKDLSLQKEELVGYHSVLLTDAIEAFTSNAEKIESNNSTIKKRILWQSKMYAWVVVMLTIFFIVMSVAKIRKISVEVVEPLEETIDATKKFVDGDYKSKIHPSKNFIEISDLQDNINKVFGVIKEESSRSEDKKKQIDAQLLKKEYIEILDYLKSNQRLNKKSNISDLKKHLGITHPTVLERLGYLERRGFISFEKEGREKFIFLKGRF